MAKNQQKAAAAIAAAPVAPVAEAPALPERIRLTAPHAFYDDAGARFFMYPGPVIKDRATIALLVGRGAAHEVVH